MKKEGWRILEIIVPYFGRVLVGFKENRIRFRSATNKPYLKPIDIEVSEDKLDKVRFLEDI